MNFDPYDPIDPLGQDAPFEMQDHSPDLIAQTELKLASDQVLRRAAEQAITSSPVVQGMISDELNRRDRERFEDELAELSEIREVPEEPVLTDSGSKSSDDFSHDQEGYVEDYTESYVSGYEE